MNSLSDSGCQSMEPEISLMAPLGDLNVLHLDDNAVLDIDSLPLFSLGEDSGIFDEGEALEGASTDFARQSSFHFGPVEKASGVS